MALEKEIRSVFRIDEMAQLFHEPNVAELEKWLDEILHDGLIRYYGLWNQERIFAASPEAIKDLLATEVYKFVKPEVQYILAENISSNGLLIQEGQEHKAARKNFAPAFSAEHIRRAYPIMWESAFDMVNAVSTQSQATSTTTARLLRPINAAAIDIIGRWAFSKVFNALKDPVTKFARSYIGMFKTTKRGQATLFAAAVIGPTTAMQLPPRAVKTIKRVMASVHGMAEKIVTAHEQSMDTTQNDMLSVAIKTGHFSHKDLVIHSVHFLAAATETVSGSIALAIHLISRHPEMQDRLRDEIRRHLPSPSPITGKMDIQESDFADMKYLDAVIKEVLRFHSINTILWRECASPARLLDTAIPVGTKAVYPPWTLGRDPKHWGPNARPFNPDRWLSRERDGCDNAYSFPTFSGGPRKCLREQYARAQMRCLIAGLFGRFELTPLKPEKESDEGQEIGNQAALTLFKIFEDWKINVREIDGR